jgi:hypothetical protein
MKKVKPVKCWYIVVFGDKDVQRATWTRWSGLDPWVPQRDGNSNQESSGVQRQCLLHGRRTS